jgi:6-pyruvoyl-tetrahydropterin synthase
MYTNAVCFEINVSKDTFKFNASHFVAYPGFRERLHGHSYRASVKLIGSNKIGRDGYVLDFGCVKSAAAAVCKTMNEYFLVPMLSEVLKITVEEDEDTDENGDSSKICGDCKNDNTKDFNLGVTQKNKRRRSNDCLAYDKIKSEDESTTVRSEGVNVKDAQVHLQTRTKYPGSVTIECEDGSMFVFPRQDCLLLPIMHSTAEELAVYLYGKILSKLDGCYLHQRGVTTMEVTVSEAVGQDATFRCPIPGDSDNEFDVARFISEQNVPVMPCATETMAAVQRI